MRAPSARPAAALLGLALASAGCAPTAPDTRFLNLDPESTSGELTAGWSAFEKTEAGDTFVWAQAREARVSVFVRDAADRVVRFRAWPFLWAGAPPQTVTLSVNDVRLEIQTVLEGPRVYTVASPAAAWKAGANVLTFAFAYAEAPNDRVPDSGDTRTLAAAIDWIEILPVREEGSRRP